MAAAVLAAYKQYVYIDLNELLNEIIELLKNFLTHFMPMVSFYTP